MIPLSNGTIDSAVSEWDLVLLCPTPVNVPAVYPALARSLALWHRHRFACGTSEESGAHLSTDGAIKQTDDQMSETAEQNWKGKERISDDD